MRFATEVRENTHNSVEMRTGTESSRSAREQLNQGTCFTTFARTYSRAPVSRVVRELFGNRRTLVYNTGTSAD